MSDLASVRTDAQSVREVCGFGNFPYLKLHSITLCSGDIMRIRNMGH